jgi:hypothetical protein
VLRGRSWSPGNTRRSRSLPVPGDGSRGHGARGDPGDVTGPGGRSGSYEARGGSGAALFQEMDAAGHAGMCVRLVFYFLLGAATRGYPVFRVPTESRSKICF